MKKIALFGGTFDPVHFGHLNLAIQLLEAHHLDEVLFCPAFQTPFKESRPPHAPADHRLAMLLLALADLPLFQPCRLEIERRGISYTVATLRELHDIYRKKNEPVEWHLLLSDESLASFHRWKEPEEIIRLAQPLIGARGGEETVPASPVAEALKRGLTETRRMEISSTEIRARLKQRLYCGHLLPAKTLDYIEKEGLYF